MILKFKKKLLLVNALFFLGYANILQAGECGVLHYVASKSSGVSVTGNACKETDDIAVGSEFNLMPGARLWFNSIGAETKKAQGICQNRSSKAIRISVDNNQLPWIKAQGLSACTPWADNKMSCEDSAGGQKALSCVIAFIDSEARPKGLEERTTSVRMRSLPAMDDGDKTAASDNAGELDKEQIISAMQPDIGLCKAIDRTAAAVKMTWLVETNGRVNAVVPANTADKPLVDCLTAVIKAFSYPQSSQATWLSNQF